jgi:hypothetical protein
VKKDTESGSEPESPDEERVAQKQIEKIKADNEKLIEKLLKREIEKPPQRETKHLKSEKFEKNEIKEHKGEKEFKNEKFEKIEHKEFKNEIKEWKPEKENKLEIKEQKSEFEKPPASEGPVIPDFTLPVHRESLLAHAETLEQAAQQLRHFIDQSERPDLSRGALKDEPDQEDSE